MLNKNLNALYAMNQCAKSIHLHQSYLNRVVSILQITDKTRRSEQDFCGCTRCMGVHSTARALEGLRANRLRLVRSVAIVIGILLSMASADRLEAQNLPTKSIKVLADKQLTDKQYKCHNKIIYLESRWKIDAVGNKSGKKQTHGYYQIKSESIKGKPYDYQFWIYWDYVSSRYGITQYDEPNYCSALHHLMTKGWQ